MTEQTSGNLDEVLARLAEILRNSDTPSTEQPAQPQPDQNPMEDGDPAQMVKFREQLAVEMMYMQMIPPLTPDVLIKIERFLQRFPEFLKSLEDRPYLMAQIDHAVGSRLQTSTDDSGERTVVGVLVGGPLWAAIAERMANDIAEESQVGDGEERLLITAGAVATFIGCVAGGVAVGAAAKKAVD